MCVFTLFSLYFQKSTDRQTQPKRKVGGVQSHSAARSAALRARAPALAGRRPAVMTASPPLCDWLRDRAGISPKIMGPTMLWLTQEEVFEVDDLIVLRKEGGLRDGFTRVTAAKIEAALDAIEAPPTEPPKGSVLPMAPPPTNTNSFATPDRASRTRSALNLDPSSPTEAVALRLFTPPPPTALDATPVPPRAPVPPKTSALQPSAAAVLLQAGARRIAAHAPSGPGFRSELRSQRHTRAGNC